MLYRAERQRREKRQMENCSSITGNQKDVMLMLQGDGWSKGRLFDFVWKDKDAALYLIRE